MRKFVIGEADFPASMALTLTVLPVSVALSAFNYPYRTLGEHPALHLYMSGINYTLWTGPNMSDVIALTSVHRPPHPALLTDNRDVIMARARNAHQSAMKLRQTRELRGGRRG